MYTTINILIIEDNTDDAYLITKLLERAGLKFQSTLISEKSEFINEMAVASYDVILSDNSMSQFNSRDVINFLKQNNLTTPVIIVSGTVTPEFAAEMIKEGVFDYINKDNIKQLLESIKRAVPGLKNNE